jgi:SAM-dependent methyltransferase
VKRCLACERSFGGSDWRCPGCGFSPPEVMGFPAFATGLTAQDIGFDASRFEVLARVERGHFWFSSRSRLIAWAVRRHFPGARSLLEIGCGTGNVLAVVAEDTAIPRLAGSEAHTAGLAFAARHAPGAELLQMDARRVPYRDEFDVVAAFDVIEHIAEDDAVLGEMFAACRSGGGVVITVPQHPWLWSQRDVFAGHRRRYRRAALLKKLAAAGFERPWTTSFVTLLLPLLALSRLRQRAAQGVDASRELEVGRTANRVCAAVMLVERGLIAAGVPMPFGGSLLVVAHKR